MYKKRRTEEGSEEKAIDQKSCPAPNLYRRDNGVVQYSGVVIGQVWAQSVGEKPVGEN